MKENRDRSESAAAGADEERELRAVAALLRSLPDPEPPEDLTERVMAEVRRRESGPRVLRVAFQRFEPLIATAVAAGLGALVLITAVQSGLFPPGGPGSPGTTASIASTTGLQPSVARPVDVEIAGMPRVRRPLEPTLTAMPGDFHSAALIGVAPQTAVVGPMPTTSSLDRRLDHQINRLLLDPEAFYGRIQQMEQPDSFVARLADRAARRGDAAEVALRLRQRSPDHPQTSVLVDRLLRASLARQVPLQ
ncbi:MAG: hypothetical protein ACQGVC_02580 [Myxococcota bacterium]